jgi:hypothetical protein
VGACHGCSEAGHRGHSGPEPRRNGAECGQRDQRSAPMTCYVCGKVGHLAAQCARRAQSQEAVAAATEEEVRGVEAVDPEEFQAFPKWRAALQEAESAEEWEQGGCALGAIALATQAAALGVQVQTKEGVGVQRGRGRMREGGVLGDPRATRSRTSVRQGCAGMRRAKGPPDQGWLNGRVDAADHQRDASRAVLPRPSLGQPTVSPAVAPLRKHVAILDRDPRGHRGGLTEPHSARIGELGQARKHEQDWGMELLRLT